MEAPYGDGAGSGKRAAGSSALRAVARQPTGSAHRVTGKRGGGRACDGSPPPGCMADQDIDPGAGPVADKE